METRVVSSLEKVFCGSVFKGERLEKISALKGERVSFQIAVCCSDIALLEITCADARGLEKQITFREVQSVPSLMPAPPEDTFTLRTEPGLFPDPLVPMPKGIGVTSNNWHAVWVSVDIPKEFAPGKYTLKFNVKAVSRYSSFAWYTDPAPEVEESLELEIVNAVLPEQQLKVTHWFHADCILHHHHVSAWSEEHWGLLEKYFRNFAQHHSNMLLTPLWSLPLDMIPGVTSRPVCQLLRVSYDKGCWGFDFTLLERWITTAQKCGIKNFEMVHAFSQWGLHTAPEIMVTQEGKEKPFFGASTPGNSPEYAEFLRALMKEMLPVLKKHGLTRENCYFHISDEPSESALENYRYASQLFRGLVEDYPVIDALSSIKFFKEGLVERPVPMSNELDEFMKEDVAERWVYYCYSPGHSPGRQFGMPSLRNRVLGILLYVYGCDGFLEWGYNYWFSQYNRTWDVDPWQETNCQRSFRSGGAFLVYPGADGPVDSLRHEVIAEGFRDEMALRLLESRTSREEVLKWIDEQTGYRITMEHYPHEDSWLLELRHKLNLLLAER